MIDISILNSLGPTVTVKDGGQTSQIAAQPLVVEDVIATGGMQTIALPTALPRQPSLVRVIIREPPSVKVGDELMSTHYRVEYGTHEAKAVNVKLTFSAKALPPKFDVLIFP